MRASSVARRHREHAHFEAFGRAFAGAFDAIANAQRRIADVHDARRDGDFVVVQQRLKVACAALDDREQHAFVAHLRADGEAARTQQFLSRDVEIPYRLSSRRCPPRRSRRNARVAL